jgi:hypothetical protein
VRLTSRIAPFERIDVATMAFFVWLLAAILLVTFCVASAEKVPNAGDRMLYAIGGFFLGGVGLLFCSVSAQMAQWLG